MKMLLTKKFAFEMAHALPGYEGKCANLHGHSYHLDVTVEGTVMHADGMTVDFHLLKELVEHTVVERFDHALVLPRGAGIEAPNLVEVDFQPTTENLLLHFARLLEPVMPEGARLYSLRLAETDTSVAELVM